MLFPATQGGVFVLWIGGDWFSVGHGLAKFILDSKFYPDLLLELGYFGGVLFEFGLEVEDDGVFGGELGGVVFDDLLDDELDLFFEFG